jgi:hypothetical protein
VSPDKRKSGWARTDFDDFAGQIVVTIAQKSGEIWTGQADLQPMSFKSGRLLARDAMIAGARLVWTKAHSRSMLHRILLSNHKELTMGFSTGVDQGDVTLAILGDDLLGAGLGLVGQLGQLGSRLGERHHVAGRKSHGQLLVVR